MNIPTGIVTFLFTDIEGSTKLAQEFPEKLLLYLEKHNTLLHESIESNRGFVFKKVGDAFCSAFESADDAVKAAIEAQLKLSDEKWDTSAIKVRMGIHIGNAEWNGKDYMGYMTLARTSRIMSAAYGEQILVSNDAMETLKSNNEISYRDLGMRRLKDVIEPIRLYQVSTNRLREDFPPLKTLDARPNNLPVQLTSFIGREDEIKQIKNAFKQTRLLTLTGSGGSGKTRLSLQISADVIDDFENGVWFIEIASLSDAVSLLQAIMKVFGLKEQPKRNPEETICEYLHEKEMLVILDNCEHLIAPCAYLAVILLSNSPKLKIISTSREALRCDGEQIHRVRSLDSPDPNEEISPENLLQYEAVRLFMERALLINKDFRLTNDNAPYLKEICYRLDGIPLAIELAAARTKILSVEKIFDRLKDRFRLLSGGIRTALPRQQTLKALIDWSHDLLTDEEKIFWRRLSVFTAGWTIEAAEEVCSDEILEKERILALSDQLAEKSIIVYDPEKERYRILETIKQYGEEKLREANETESVKAKHLYYFMDFAEKSEVKLKGSEEKIWLEILETEQSNIQSAIEWSATKAGEKEEGARLASASQIFWSIRGHITTGKRLLESVLANQSEVSKEVLGKVKTRLGSQLIFLGEFEKSKEYLEEGLMLLRECGEKIVITDTINMLGNVEMYLGDYRMAQKLFEENLSISRSTGNKHVMALTLNNLGNKKYIEGNYAEAQRLYEESLALRRELGNVQGIAISLYNLGNITLDQGEYEKSRKLFEESLEISREIGDKRMIASSLNCLGGIATIQEEYERARKLIEESLTLNRGIGEKRNIARSLSFLGRLEQNLGFYEKAQNIFEETFALTSQIGEKNGIAFALNDLGNVLFLLENYEQSQKYYEESLALRQELSEKRAIAQSLWDMGNVLYITGKYEKARKYFTGCLELRIETGESINIPPTLIGLACAIADKDMSLSAILLGAAEENLKSAKVSLTKIEQKLMLQITAMLQEKLGDDEFMKYFDEGRKLTLNEAADIILKN